MKENDSTKEWLHQLKTKLNNKLTPEHPLEAPYKYIAKAFPGELLQDSFDLHAIDFRALRKWAGENGWGVDTSPDTTPPERKRTPNIKFSKVR